MIARNLITQNADADNSQVYVIYATSLAEVGSDVGASMNWIEFD